MTDKELREVCLQMTDPSHGIPMNAVSFAAAVHGYGGVVGAAHRLLELLPPPDDAEPITAEWLQAVGFERGEKFETLSIDLIEGNMLHYSPTLGWWWLSAKHGDKVSAGVQPTRAHVRQLCASFGIKLKETA